MPSKNKFQKSVMERMEMEKESAQTQKVYATPKELIPKEELVPDLLDYLAPSKQRQAKNKTFYLDVEVVDTLHQAAQKQKITDSRLCNDILRKVLGLH